MSAWKNDATHQLIELHAETLMHRHSFLTHWQKVLDKNLEPQGPTRINYRGEKLIACLDGGEKEGE